MSDIWVSSVILWLLYKHRAVFNFLTMWLHLLAGLIISVVHRTNYIALGFVVVQGLCNPFSLFNFFFFFQQTHTLATLIIMKITNYSSNTHYVVHILTPQTALDSWCTEHQKFSSISVALTASQNCSCPQTDKVLVLQHICFRILYIPFIYFET